MERERYLRRIGIVDDVLPPNAATLERLHRAHLEHVPFENLDVHLGRRIELDEELILAKIVDDRRGGYCYEANGAFAWLLRELGFEVQLLAAGVYDKDAERFGPIADHLCLRVELDGAWLADVGFGRSFRSPMRLEDGAEQIEEELISRLERVGDRWTLLAREPDGAWEPQYRFDVRPLRLFDFTYANHWMQTAPASPFLRRRICTRATPTGRVTLADRSLIELRDGVRTERAVADDEVRAVLADRFGISIGDEGASLP